MNKRNKENIKHQIAEFKYQNSLMASCDLGQLDLNNIKIRRLPSEGYLLESGKFHLAWEIDGPIIKSIDLFIDGKKDREIEVKELLSDYYPLFDKLFKPEEEEKQHE